MEAKLSHTAVVACPRNMVGRVIGKGGETIKALQQYTGAVIQIDQSQDPTRVTIAGEVDSLKLAVSMIQVLRAICLTEGFQAVISFVLSRTVVATSYYRVIRLCEPRC